ncbi:unnamed protein product [Chilo suppressalis]|uniref:FLYWCH-type domain-containing protein n=1 Tax=Chilo suppressalis TaxID=168631 RepID=A0ABN8B0Z9_CHISP|nr:unnamed protein product [Chilo suppressalis]
MNTITNDLNAEQRRDDGKFQICLVGKDQVKCTHEHNHKLQLLPFGRKYPLLMVNGHTYKRFSKLHSGRILWRCSSIMRGCKAKDFTELPRGVQGNWWSEAMPSSAEATVSITSRRLGSVPHTLTVLLRCTRLQFIFFHRVPSRSTCS